MIRSLSCSLRSRSASRSGPPTMASSGISSSSKDNTLSSDVSLAESLESSNPVSRVPAGSLSDVLLTSVALFTDVSASTNEDFGSVEFGAPSDV